MIIDFGEIKRNNLNKKLSFLIKDEKWKSVFEEIDDHYNLLSYLSTKISNGIIIDIGTHVGLSALALSFNPLNKIYTYDITASRGGIKQNIDPIPKNIKWNIKNIFDDLNLLLKADLIFIDIDHKGIIETKICDYLMNNNYKGFVLLDGIYFHDPMIQFWDKLTVKKYDLTSVGHYQPGHGGSKHIKQCGTGLLDFQNQIKIIKQKDFK